MGSKKLQQALEKLQDIERKLANKIWSMNPETYQDFQICGVRDKDIIECKHCGADKAVRYGR